MKTARGGRPGAASPSSPVAESSGASPCSVDDVLAESATHEPVPPGVALVGECLDVMHPVLTGRVLVRLALPRGPVERWVPTLHGLSLRVGDRVLVQRPANWPEAIVLGTVDGYARRPEPVRVAARSVELLRDESVMVLSAEGQPLVELYQGDSGPVVRLASGDVAIDVAGDLRVSARSVELAARAGEARLNASADVVVRGESIRLN